MSNSKKIIILGAGFAGLRCANILAKYYPGQVVLIDKNNYHFYTALLYELDEKKVKLPIKTRAQFIQREVKDYHSLDFDYLVLATGVEINYYNIPGLKENALTFKDLPDIKQLRKILSGQILIIGAGVTGVELACELALKLKNEKITLLDACPVILPNLEPDLRKKAEKQLRKLGIEILTNLRLKRVEKNKAFFENGQHMKFDNLTWTGGARLGKYKVDKYLWVIGEKNVFAIGDCADAYPGLIQPALEQAKIAALNIKRTIENKPLICYQPKRSGIIIPLGKHYAIGKIGKIKLVGFLPWLIKKIINYYYLKTYGQ